MRQGTTFLKRSATVFSVLAWVLGGIQVVTGVVLLAFGPGVLGTPTVTMLGTDVPVRLISVWNFLAAPVYWFVLTFISRLTHLALEVHAQVTKTSA